jgi:ferric-dicitrate binding protein FerR (iron transport regulator)
MSVFIPRGFLCWVLVAILPASLLGQSTSQTQLQTPAQSSMQTMAAPSAVLHTQGGVWVNDYEAHDSTSIFTGDLIETKPGFSATLTLEGTEVQVQPQSVLKFQGDFVELDHGDVAVSTSKSFKVKVNCLTVVPVLNEWTQYEVTDVNGTVQVAAHKLDVNVRREGGRGKTAPESAVEQKASVKEGQQQNYDGSEICGAPAQPTSAGNGMNPKWIEIGAGVVGGGVLICLVLLCRSGGKAPVSPDTP